MCLPQYNSHCQIHLFVVLLQGSRFMGTLSETPNFALVAVLRVGEGRRRTERCCQVQRRARFHILHDVLDRLMYVSAHRFDRALPFFLPAERGMFPSPS